MAEKRSYSASVRIFLKRQSLNPASWQDPASRVRPAALAKALWALTKPRLAFFSILTSMAAYATTQTSGDPVLALVALAGISLAAAGALSLNQWWERGLDGRMRRTRDRPLPRNALPHGLALAWSILLSVSGLMILAFLVDLLAAVFAGLTIIVYGLIYTPLKRRTRWATEVGSLSGALPPLIGAAAGGEPFSVSGVSLFLVLLFWQMPHFYAIGWMHRDDYQAAGFPLLPATDPDGRRTARWSTLYTSLLLAASLLPWLLGWFGAVYGAAALLGGLLFLGRALAFQRAAGDSSLKSSELRPFARALFLASVKYLPLLLAGMTVDWYLKMT